MKEFYLNYYPNFKCIASDCKHTCCAGWVMNIDEKTLENYKNEQNLDFNQTNILLFRQKILDIVQDRKVDINERIKKVLNSCKANISEKDLNGLVKFYLSLSRLDKAWTSRLKSIKGLAIATQVKKENCIYCEQ